MSDSRRRSSRSSSTSHNRSSGSSSTNPSSSSSSLASISTSSSSNTAPTSSSSRHRSSRHGSSNPNRSSTSLHRISGSSSHGRSRESLVAPSSTPAVQQASNSSYSYNNPPAPAAGPGPDSGGGIYGSLAARASESRFSLTDQFASTRSVLDFGFDDGASSIFDTQSIYSQGSSRAPSLYGGAGVDTVGMGLDPFPELSSHLAAAGSGPGSLMGSPWQAEEEYLGGAYSTVLEENEDLADDDDTATIGGRDEYDDNNNNNASLYDGASQTPKSRRSRAASSAEITVIDAGDVGGSSNKSGSERPQDADMLDEPLRLPVPVFPPSHQQRQSYLASQLAARAASIAPVYRTYYDLLCLSQEQFPPPSAPQIRASYYRLFRLLNSNVGHGGDRSSSGASNTMPAALRPYAEAYFLEIQTAFETLIDPIRRLEYDRYLDDVEDELAARDGYLDDEDDSESDGADQKKKFDGKENNSTSQSFPAPQGPSFVRKYDFQTTTDMGARYVVSGSRGGTKAGIGHLFSTPNLTSLDYSLTQTLRVGVPILRTYTEVGLFRLQQRVQQIRHVMHERYGVGAGPGKANGGDIVIKGKDGRTYLRRASVHADQPLWPVRCGIPIVSLSASTYALSAAAATAGSIGGMLPPLADRYQPLLVEVLGPARIAQLAHTRASGNVVLGYRQEFWNRSALTAASAAAAAAAGSGNGQLLPPPPSTVVDVETEMLPRVAMTTRIAHAVRLPASVRKLETGLFGSPSDEPLHVEAMVHGGESFSLLSALSGKLSLSLPRLGLGISRRVGHHGNLFLCADSGNAWWGSYSSSPSTTSSLIAPLLPPMVEVGYNLGPHELGLHAGRPLTGPADRGLKGVDMDMDLLGGVTAYTKSADRRNHRRNQPVSPHGTWTVSAATTGLGSAATYVRYGRTVFLTPLGRRPPAALPANATTRRRQRQTPQRAVRIEAELCAADASLLLPFSLSDGYLAVRALAPIRWWGLRNGWTSNATSSFRSSTPASTTPPKIGLEVALSAGSGGNGSLHVSLYWSRMGQRLKLPLLLLPASSSSATSTKLFFWAAIVPVAAMAIREFAQIYYRAAKLRFKSVVKKRAAAKAKSKHQLDFEHGEEEQEQEQAGFVFDEEEDLVITRHRAEADELTTILASAVDAQHYLERHTTGRDDRYDASPRPNELVILSAKYGVALTDDPDDDPAGHTRHDSATSGLGFGRNSIGSSPPITAMASRNGWAPDYEVADVTAAVSALIVTGSSGSSAGHGADGDYLYIPAGLRKSRILGFWDPAPSYQKKQAEEKLLGGRAKGKKVLHVRYLWNGQERIAEVGDRAELRLPEV